MKWFRVSEIAIIDLSMYFGQIELQTWWHKQNCWRKSVPVGYIAVSYLIFSATISATTYWTLPSA